VDAIFALPIGALLIFSLRVIDVSMSTIRMILVVRGRRELAAAIGFVEVLIWITAVGQALQHVNSPLHLIGYAGGFATGNYVGVWLEERLALGLSVLHAVTRLDSKDGTAGESMLLADRLRDAGYAVTHIEGQGRDGNVGLLKIVVPRRRVHAVHELLRDYDPDVFVTTEEVLATRGGYMQLAGRKMPALRLPIHLSLQRSSAALKARGRRS